MLPLASSRDHNVKGREHTYHHEWQAPERSNTATKEVVEVDVVSPRKEASELFSASVCALKGKHDFLLAIF
jgi:hypothetical protein